MGTREKAKKFAISWSYFKNTSLPSLIRTASSRIQVIFSWIGADGSAKLSQSQPIKFGEQNAGSRWLLISYILIEHALNRFRSLCLTLRQLNSIGSWWTTAFPGDADKSLAAVAASW